MLVVAACNPSGQAQPTVSSITMAQTSVALTQSAPPAGFASVSFPNIDAHLADQPAWSATLAVTFDGVFTSTQEKATGKLDAQIYSDELTSGRRVLFDVTGTAFGVTDTRAIEAVRLSNDYYQVTQKNCSHLTDAANQKIADLTAGSLLGGVTRGTPTGQRDTFGKLAVWEYSFLPNTISAPLVHIGSGSLTVASGDLWVAPSINAVARFTLTVNVQNVSLFQGNQNVTGQLREVYNLPEVGTLYNIAVPFGC